MDELNLKIILLEEEMKFLREQIENLTKRDSNIYQQILAKYQEPDIVVETDRKITHNNIEYTVDKNNFLWDDDGYVCGWLEGANVILNKDS